MQILDIWVQQASTFLRGMMRAYAQASVAARGMTFRAEFRCVVKRSENELVFMIE